MKYAIITKRHTYFTLDFEAAIVLSEMLNEKHCIKMSKDCMFGDVESSVIIDYIDGKRVITEYKQYTADITSGDLYIYFIRNTVVTKGTVMYDKYFWHDNWTKEEFLTYVCSMQKDIGGLKFVINGEVIALIENGVLHIYKRPEHILEDVINIYKKCKGD